VVENGQRQLLLDISEEVGAWHDHGLLGFALHPQFDTNGYIYLLYLVDRHYLTNFGTAAYNPATNDYYSATIGRFTRYKVTRTGGAYAVVAGSLTILLGATKTTGIPSTERSHVTGSLVFGIDGTLLVSTGGTGSNTDFGSTRGTYYTQALADGIIQPRENVGSFRAQLVNCLSGKILRLDPMTRAGVPSNPFYDTANPNSPRSKVWALGLRNPFRMSLKPGTGSPNPTAANPGALYVGDVGFSTWEEMDVVDRAGQNMGWPLFEGLTQHDPLIAHLTANQDAPNPLFNVNGCTQQYFNFQDLLKQATPTGTATFTNSCNAAQAIPASIPTFVQTRPLIDWQHGTGPSRTRIFSGNMASTINLGASGSPVSGPQFGGSAAVGGVFYPFADFSAGYQNTYFFGDYVGGWIRSLTVNASNQPTAVRDFVGTGAVVVGMATHPTQPGLYYINFPDEIRKITYSTTNNAPTAVATSNKQYGPAPLSIQFTGSASTDPEGQTLTYLWNFGDGTTSTQPNPAHTFSPGTSAPVGYPVTLTVTDPQGATGQATLRVSANNTPPQVTITSPANNTLYPLTGTTIYQLRATVTDQEHSASQLSYAWQTILHHETHEHPEPIDTAPQTTTSIDPLGCGAETYYYTIDLTVTDATGLSTKQRVRLDPDYSTAPAYTFYRAINLNEPALTLDGNAGARATAANYTTDGFAFENQAVPLTPATDAARAAMIRAAVYRGGSLNLALTAVPAGTYQAYVYVYVWEDNFAQTFSLALNGQTVLANYNSGPADTWAKLGPFTATLPAPSTLQLTTTTGGDANFSGVELWQQTAAARQVATAQQLSTSSQPVQVFPNPSHNGRLKLLLPAVFQQGSTYTLLSALGSTLAVGTLGHQQDVADLNFSQLLTASGMYYLHLQSKSQSTYLKLLRE
jgi:PKD repeat protein